MTQCPQTNRAAVTGLHLPRVSPIHSHNALHPFAQLLDLDNLLLLHALQELRELGREASIGVFTDSTYGAPPIDGQVWCKVGTGAL